MQYRFGPITVSEETRQLLRDGKAVHLEPRVFDLILYLVRNRDRVVPKEELFGRIWGGRTISEASLSVGISAARKALGDSPVLERHIETHRGRGYRFVGRVAEEPPLASAAPAGLGGAPDPGTTFVGRSQELARLRTALVRASGGHGALVLVSGEPGIGKTRLCAVLADLARQCGVAVATARCHEVDAAPPGWPWVQVMRSLLEPDRCCARPEGGARGLMHWVGMLEGFEARAEETPHAQPDQERFRIFDGVTRLLTAESGSQPLLVIFDDAHRADELSLDLLRYLGRELAELRVLIAVTYRDTELASRAGWRRVLPDLASLADTIALEGLSPSETSRFLAAALGREPDDALTTQVRAQTGGNPLFLTQLAPLLARLGADAHAIRLEGRFPEGLREVILQRIDTLPEPCGDLLRIASVVGRSVRLRILCTVTGLEVDEIRERVGPALSARLLVADEAEPDRLRFAHILVREVLYDELPPRSRSVLNQRVGETLESLSGADLEPHLYRLAHHFYEAGPDRAGARALEYAQRAGALANAHCDYEKARTQHRRALELLELLRPDDNHARADLLLGLGHAETRGGDRAAARRTFNRAAKVALVIDAPEKLGRAALGIAPGLLSIEAAVLDSLHVELMEKAIHALERRDPKLRARLEARLAMALFWSDETQLREELCDEAWAIASAQRDPELRTFVQISRWLALWDPHDFPGRRSLAEKIVSHGSSRDRESALVSRLFFAAALLEHGEVDASQHEIDAYRRLASELRQPQAAWYATLFESNRALCEGRLTDAEALRDRFSRLGSRVEDANAFQCSALHRIFIHREMGRLRDLLPLIQQGASRYPRMLSWRVALAETQLELGNRARVEAELARILEMEVVALEWTQLTAWQSLVCHELDHAALAARLYQRLAPCSGYFVVGGIGAGCWGSADRYLGLLASTMSRWELAERHFERSLEQEARTGAALWLAHARFDYARMLMRRAGPGDRERARHLAGDSLREARRLGLLRLTEHAERFLEGSLSSFRHGPSRVRRAPLELPTRQPSRGTAKEA